MAILGLTKNSSGQSVQRLPVIGKVSIGLAPSGDRKFPQKLDHFQFLKKIIVDKGPEKGEAKWVVDEEVTAAMKTAYGENPREVGIVLLDDDPEIVFKNNLAWWKATEWHCKGELVQIEASQGAGDPGVWGMRAIRKTNSHPEGEPWPGEYRYNEGPNKGQPVEGCGDGCPDLEAGKCKPSGDLYFILEKFPEFGGAWRIHTTSYRSVANISNGLQQIRSILGGRLAGIRVTLQVQPEKIKYESDDGSKKSSVGHILNVNVAAEDLPKLISKMTEFARMFVDARKLLNAPVVIEENDDDPDRAKELAGEFYPDRQLTAGTEEETKVPKAEIPNMEDVPVLSKIRKLGEQLKWTKAKIEMTIGQYDGKLPELLKKMEVAADLETPTAQTASPQKEEVLTKETKATETQADKKSTKADKVDKKGSFSW